VSLAHHPRAPADFWTPRFVQGRLRGVLGRGRGLPTHGRLRTSVGYGCFR
jgi:hypothetical protein